MIKDIQGLLAEVYFEIKKRTDLAVVGMSGGADSTLVATLCVAALGADKVYAVHMPYGEFDHKTFNSRSVKTAEKLGVNSMYVTIGRIADSISESVSDAFSKASLTNVNTGNSRSRARMAVLYGVAHHLGTLGSKVRVVGTGNLGEDYIGYDTKGGDALTDFFPIGDLFKSEVYQLLDYFRDLHVIDDDMIDRKPSAGLWEGHSDAEELGYSYDEMEPSIRRLMASDFNDLSKVIDANFDKVIPAAKGAELLHGTYLEILALDALRSKVDRFVFERHVANKHKHEAPPNVALRAFCD